MRTSRRKGVVEVAIVPIISTIVLGLVFAVTVTQISVFAMRDAQAQHAAYSIRNAMVFVSSIPAAAQCITFETTGLFGREVLKVTADDKNVYVSHPLSVSKKVACSTDADCSAIPIKQKCDPNKKTCVPGASHFTQGVETVTDLESDGFCVVKQLQSDCLPKIKVCRQDDAGCRALDPNNCLGR